MTKPIASCLPPTYRGRAYTYIVAPGQACANTPRVKVVVATHGHCFDGLASAVLFTRLLAALGDKRECVYRACGYGNGQSRADEGLLSGVENAILDYRYTASQRVTWFFDHHR